MIHISNDEVSTYSTLGADFKNRLLDTFCLLSLETEISFENILFYTLDWIKQQSEDVTLGSGKTHKFTN